MNCPPKIAKVLLEIIRFGILNCRASGWGKEAERCALEADHIHNIPSLLLNYNPELLDFYWEKERPNYIAQHRRLGFEKTGFERLWRELKRAVPQLKNDSATAT